MTENSNSEAAHSLDEAESQWSGEELEAAYTRALAALDAVESEIVATAEELAPGTASRLEVGEAESPRLTSMEPVRDVDPDDVNVTAEQIVEACLFVGGVPLTAQRLVGVLRSTYTAEHIESMIEGLNRRYQQQQRPYEIRLGEGGYRLMLREEFERIRHKVYGLGPKEVRLSQDALEVLALVAYHQPLTEEQLSALGRPECGAVLRLLLRRELIVVDRDPAAPKVVRYATTPRFLSLFGLGSLDDLPRPEQLLYK